MYLFVSVTWGVFGKDLICSNLFSSVDKIIGEEICALQYIVACTLCMVREIIKDHN